MADVKQKVHKVMLDRHSGKELADEISFPGFRSVDSGNWFYDCEHIRQIEQQEFETIFNRAWSIVESQWSSIETLVANIAEVYCKQSDVKEAMKTSVHVDVPNGVAARLYLEVWTRGNWHPQAGPSLLRA